MGYFHSIRNIYVHVHTLDVPHQGKRTCIRNIVMQHHVKGAAGCLLGFILVHLVPLFTFGTHACKG